MKTVVFLIMFLVLYSMKSQDLSGKWLEVKDGYTYTMPEVGILEFIGNKIIQYNFDETVFESSFVVKENELFIDGTSWGRISWIDSDRFGLLSQGQTNNRDTMLRMDYVQLKPTKTIASKEAIESKSYDFRWKDENYKIEFDPRTSNDLNSPVLKKKMDEITLLESVGTTLFVSIFRNGERDIVIPILSVSHEGMELYGMPLEPFVVWAPALD